MTSQELSLHSEGQFLIDFGKKEIAIPKIRTYLEDGRLPIEDIYGSFANLALNGWEVDLVDNHKHHDNIGGVDIEFPVICLRTPKKGNALWFIAGIHGEEPAGPIALARSISKLEELRELGFSVVVYPLANPIGYSTDSRFLRKYRGTDNPFIHPSIETDLSVGDTSHLLPGSEDPSRPRYSFPSSKEAAAFTHSVLQNCQSYPPFLVIDLHEDNDPITCFGSYVYREGRFSHKAADCVLQILSSHQEIILKGRTRFEDTRETISNGVVQQQCLDYSIDNLLAARKIFNEFGEEVEGPRAPAVIVVETSVLGKSLKTRVQAHVDIINNADKIIRLVARELVF